MGVLLANSRVRTTPQAASCGIQTPSWPRAPLAGVVPSVQRPSTPRMCQSAQQRRWWWRQRGYGGSELCVDRGAHGNRRSRKSTADVALKPSVRFALLTAAAVRHCDWRPMQQRAAADGGAGHPQPGHFASRHCRVSPVRRCRSRGSAEEQTRGAPSGRLRVAAARKCRGDGGRGDRYGTQPHMYGAYIRRRSTRRPRISVPSSVSLRVLYKYEAMRALMG